MDSGDIEDDCRVYFEEAAEMKKLPSGICVERDHYGQRWKDWVECQDCSVIENCSALTLQRVLADKPTSIAIVKGDGDVWKAGGMKQ